MKRLLLLLVPLVLFSGCSVKEAGDSALGFGKDAGGWAVGVLVNRFEEVSGTDYEGYFEVIEATETCLDKETGDWVIPNVSRYWMVRKGQDCFDEDGEPKFLQTKWELLFESQDKRDRYVFDAPYYVLEDGEWEKLYMQVGLRFGDENFRKYVKEGKILERSHNFPPPNTD